VLIFEPSDTTALECYRTAILEH